MTFYCGDYPGADHAGCPSSVECSAGLELAVAMYDWGHSTGARVQLGLIDAPAMVDGWQTSSKPFPRGYRAGLGMES